MHNAEFVQYETSDGLLLPGLLFEPQTKVTKKKAVIHIHGNSSSSVFYRHGYELAQVLNQAGVSLLLFNNRGAHIIKSFTIGEGERRVRRPYGMAHELIRECVADIDASVEFLRSRGYAQFTLAGASTGANKICVYDHYKPDNVFDRYVLEAGGDDTGLYYQSLGHDRFFRLLDEAKHHVRIGEGSQLIAELINEEIFSWQGYYDICNPDGDYNCFPYYEKNSGTKLSSKPLFRYFSTIKKPSMVVYGELDEYSGGVGEAIQTLRTMQPSFEYKVVAGADHGFHGHEEELAQIVTAYVK